MDSGTPVTVSSIHLPLPGATSAPPRTRNDQKRSTPGFSNLSSTDIAQYDPLKTRSLPSPSYSACLTIAVAITLKSDSIPLAISFNLRRHWCHAVQHLAVSYPRPHSHSYPSRTLIKSHFASSPCLIQGSFMHCRSARFTLIRCRMFVLLLYYVYCFWY